MKEVYTLGKEKTRQKYRKSKEVCKILPLDNPQVVKNRKTPYLIQLHTTPSFQRAFRHLRLDGSQDVYLGSVHIAENLNPIIISISKLDPPGNVV